MELKTDFCSPISVFLIIFVIVLVASATSEEFNPDYPVGLPRSQGGIGYVTEANHDDGWYNAIDWGEQYTEKDSTGLYGKYHAGEDWNDERGGSSDVGAPVYAIAGGTVIAIKDEIYANHNYGSGIVIEHTLPNGEKIYSVYVHIDLTPGLSKGDFVGRGDRIGTIAAISPLSPHLHFEIRTKWVEQGQDWWPNDYMNTGYYASKEGLLADGLIDPSDFIDSHRFVEPAKSGIPSAAVAGASNTGTQSGSQVNAPSQGQLVTVTLYVYEGIENGPIYISPAQVTGHDGLGYSFQGTAYSQGIDIRGYPGTWSFTVSANGHETSSWTEPITDYCTKNAVLQKAVTQ